MKTRKLKNKTIISILAIGMISFNAMAQLSNIGDAIDDATDEVRGWITPMTSLLWVFAALVASVGAYKVFQKYQNQDNDTLKAAMTFAGGFIFIVVANLVIKSVFNV